MAAKMKPYTMKPRLCACGCGIKFNPRRSFQKYLNPKHGARDWQIKRFGLKEIGVSENGPK